MTTQSYNPSKWLLQELTRVLKEEKHDNEALVDELIVQYFSLENKDIAELLKDFWYA